MTPPFILTLALDPASQAGFDALRNAHFPPDRLVVGAHVTMFHALPGDLDVASPVQQAADATAQFPVTVAGLRFLGRGVAFQLESPALLTLRSRLRAQWADRLTAQDSQKWQPHVTIQNKAQTQAARSLYNDLSATFARYDVTATGLALWIYRNGPWEAAGHFAFKQQ